MDNLLRSFNGDLHTKEALLEYLTLYFKAQIVERALKKESTESLVDAIIELEKGFEQLELEYGLTKSRPEPENQAR